MKLFGIFLFCLSSIYAYAQQPKSLHQTLLQSQTSHNLPGLDMQINWKNLQHYSRQNYRQFRGSHRQIYRGSRQVYKNRTRIHGGSLRLHNQRLQLRGNIYLTPNKVHHNKHKLHRYHKARSRIYINGNRPYYHFKRFNYKNRFYSRQNRWINNRYYRWYIPGAAFILYQDQSCYIDGIGEGFIQDELCCIESQRICTDEFLASQYY